MKRLTIGAICAILSAGVLPAQSETGKASLEGRVSDPAGQSIQAATVKVLQTQTGSRRDVTTNADGEFHAGALPVGSYQLDATAPAFGTARVQGITLTVGETKSVNVTLQVASVSSEVTVSTDAQVVDQSDPSDSVTIDSRAVEDLPIRGRNFTEFVQLSPNVMQEQDRFGIVVNGQRSINSNISVDGVDFNDSLQGGQRGGGPNESAYFFPQLAVREFQVVRNGATAEVGRTNSGFINVVTKSGTNSYHGEGFYANRNGALTSPDAFGNDSANNSQHQFGGSLGGPIQQDKLFFFGAVEKNILSIPYTVKFNTPMGNVAVPQAILSQQGQFTQKNNPLVAFGRLDYQLSQNNSVNLQYTYAAQNGLNFGGVSGITSAAVTNNTILDRASQGVKAGLTTVFTPALLNEVRGQWAYDNRTQTPNSPLPQITINDFGTLGGNANGSYIYEATRYEILDNLSWTRGIHSFRFGVDSNFNPQRQSRETNPGGLYTFNTFADYLALKVARYQQALPANGTQGLYRGTQQDHGIYAMDTIKLRPDLTLTAGLRWDGQIEPQPDHPNPKYPITSQIPNDLKMWQPRLGIAYDVGAQGKTVVRLSAGLYDARTPAY
ncbi:MAG: TonB-dependent receptor, partial [Acidobacteriota bacterium]|nr:TonB-dependent receptor [Acidobacteriota bacterium]